MTAPADIVNGLAGRLRAIPALVALLKDGSASSVVAYDGNWPFAVDLAEAVVSLDPGKVLIAYRGTGPGQLNRNEMWRHRLSVYVKALGSMSGILNQLINGVPTGGDGLPMMFTESVHPNLTRMEVTNMEHQFGHIYEGSVIDYFEIQVIFTDRRA